MSTVNVRCKITQHHVINGVDAGGAMSAVVEGGYDVTLKSSPDGLGGPPIEDDFVEFIRGRLVTQDWVHMMDLLTGTVGSHVFYERKGGVPATTGFLKHTVASPVIHTAELNITKDGYATVSGAFECKAADETKGMADMFTTEDSQAAPASYITAARGGYRIVSAVFSPDVGDDITIYHNTAFRTRVVLSVDKESNDADVGYTQVDLIEESGQYGGSLSFQDTAVATSLVTAQRLVAAGRGTLVVTVRQGSGATAKDITVAGVKFKNFQRTGSTGKTEHTANYTITNDPGTPLTLAGDNKIIVIENAA